jgi:hypothetical protein
MSNKCKKNKPCSGAEKIHDRGNPDFRGLFISDTINITTYVRGVRMGYRFPRNADHKGFIWLSFCPWCGVDQQFPKKKKKCSKG